MKVACGVCTKLFAESACQKVTLTEEEKSAIQAAGATPLPVYHYCQACWQLMGSPYAGKYMANQLEGLLIQQGVSAVSARKAAEKYLSRLPKKDNHEDPNRRNRLPSKASS